MNRPIGEIEKSLRDAGWIGRAEAAALVGKHRGGNLNAYLLKLGVDTLNINRYSSGKEHILFWERDVIEAAESLAAKQRHSQARTEPAEASSFDDASGLSVDAFANAVLERLMDKLPLFASAKEK